MDSPPAVIEKDDAILVTGAAGLIGSAVVDLLKAEGYRRVTGIGRAQCDLMDMAGTLKVFAEAKPQHVFHAAARVYGIMGNIRNKGLSYYENAVINTNVVEAARRAGAKKITAMGTGAIYPFPSPGLPLKEDMVFRGEPHKAEDSYAHAKRALLVMLRAYEESYGLQWAYIISCNIFGPRDKFDPEFGHVVPALIKKFYDAKKAGTNVSVWGDGSAQRDFMYVKDAARVVLAIMNGLTGAANIGSGTIWRIRDIVEAIAGASGMQGRVEWDASKPNGQDYRAYDLTKIDALGFKCKWTVPEGIRETWDWYCENAARA